MCKADKLAHYSPHFITDLKSILFYLPSVVVLFVILFSLDFTPARPYNGTCEVEQVSADNDIPCYTTDAVRLSAANTNQGIRIQSGANGLKSKNPDSESFKNMVFHENYTSINKTPKFISRNSHYYTGIATRDIPVSYHKLII